MAQLCVNCLVNTDVSYIHAYDQSARYLYGMSRTRRTEAVEVEEVAMNPLENAEGRRRRSVIHEAPVDWTHASSRPGAAWAGHEIEGTAVSDAEHMESLGDGGTGGAVRQAIGEIGEIVRASRQRRRLTLQQLADCVGCTRSYLSTIETGKRSQPPSRDVLARIESALGIQDGELQRRGMWARAPKELRDEVVELERRHQEMQLMLERLAGFRDTAERDTESKSALDSIGSLLASGGLRRGAELEVGDASERLATGEQSKQKETASPEAERAGNDELVLVGGFGRLAVQVPVINKVSAGYPKGFTDLGYPARVSDEYIAVPGVHDADAFAARVCGDSMLPEYREGDVVVFSPMVDAVHGSDCFVRFSDDARAADGGGVDGADGALAGETTFKRVYFEVGLGGESLIRLQPLNPAYAPRVVRREAVGGLFRAVSVVRSVGVGD